MADIYTLEAQPRSITGKKVNQLRRQGLVPAVIYGAKFKPVTVQIPYRALELTLRQAGGTHLINLNIGGNTQSVVAYEVQRSVLGGLITHVDFLAVDATTKLKTEVPIHFINEAPGVRAGYGVLLNGVSSIEVEALPADLIDRVDVDLTPLANVNDAIYVRDLKLGDKVTILTPGDEMIVRLAVQTVHEEAEAAEVSSTEPEVIKKGKIEEDEEA